MDKLKKYSKNIHVVLFVVGTVILVGVFMSFGENKNTKEARSGQFDFDNAETARVLVGKAQVMAEMVRTDEEKATGLSYRDSLPPESGMFFVFDKPDYWGIWMKEMRFPIDVVWFDENFIVTHIESGMATSTYPKVFYPTKPSSFVLEVNAGFVEKWDIRLGQKAILE